MDYSGSHTRKKHAWGAFVEDGSAASITASGVLDIGSKVSAVQAAREWLREVLPDRHYILFNDAQGAHTNTPEGGNLVQWLPRKSAGIKRAHKVARTMFKALLQQHASTP